MVEVKKGANLKPTRKNSFLNSRNKDKEFQAQKDKVFQAFFSQPKTMLMVLIETRIERANICRYVEKFSKRNLIYLIDKGICSISKHRAGFYTSNPELIIVTIENQLNLF